MELKFSEQPALFTYKQSSSMVPLSNLSSAIRIKCWDNKKKILYNQPLTYLLVIDNYDQPSLSEIISQSDVQLQQQSPIRYSDNQSHTGEDIVENSKDQIEPFSKPHCKGNDRSEISDVPALSQLLVDLNKCKNKDCFPIIKQFLEKHDANVKTQIIIQHHDQEKKFEGRTPLKIFLDLLRERKIQCSSLSEALELCIKKGAFFNTLCFKKLEKDKEIYESPLEAIIVGSKNQDFYPQDRIPLRCLLYQYKDDFKVSDIIKYEKYGDRQWFSIIDHFNALCDNVKYIEDKTIYAIITWQADIISSLQHYKDYIVALDTKVKFVNQFVFHYRNKTDNAKSLFYEYYEDPSGDPQKMLTALLQCGIKPYLYCNILGAFPYEEILSIRPSTAEIEISDILLNGIGDYFLFQDHAKVKSWLLCMKYLKLNMHPPLKKMIADMICKETKAFKSEISEIMAHDQWRDNGIMRNKLHCLIANTLNTWRVHNPVGSGSLEIK